MENIMTSTPLYEKIIVDRKNMNMEGFTYEKPNEKSYSERYLYQDLNGTVDYKIMLFKDPGWNRRIRS